MEIVFQTNRKQVKMVLFSLVALEQVKVWRYIVNLQLLTIISFIGSIMHKHLKSLLIGHQ